MLEGCIMQFIIPMKNWYKVRNFKIFFLREFYLDNIDTGSKIECRKLLQPDLGCSPDPC